MLEMGTSGLMSGEGKPPAACRPRSSALPRLYRIVESGHAASDQNVVEGSGRGTGTSRLMSHPDACRLHALPARGDVGRQLGRNQPVVRRPAAGPAPAACRPSKRIESVASGIDQLVSYSLRYERDPCD